MRYFENNLYAIQWNLGGGSGTYFTECSKTAELADDETLDAAHALWYVLLQQKVSTQIAHALDTRGLLPVTIRTLAALLHDAISPLYKQD